jgi:hypothetical protein
MAGANHRAGEDWEKAATRYILASERIHKLSSPRRIAGTHTARILGWALEQRPFFTFEGQGLWVPACARTTRVKLLPPIHIRARRTCPPSGSVSLASVCPTAPTFPLSESNFDYVGKVRFRSLRHGDRHTLRPIRLVGGKASLRRRAGLRRRTIFAKGRAGDESSAIRFLFSALSILEGKQRAKLHMVRSDTLKPSPQSQMSAFAPAREEAATRPSRRMTAPPPSLEARRTCIRCPCIDLGCEEGGPMVLITRV